MDRALGVAGADTHKDSITFAIIDSTGADVALRSFEVTSEGVVEIITWLHDADVKVQRVGIEGSAGWGLPVSKALVAAGFDVREVNPARTSDRRRRRRRQKTDSEDALAVAREVLADAGLPPAAAAQPVSAAHAEISVVAERRRTLIRRRQRLLNEAVDRLRPSCPSCRSTCVPSSAAALSAPAYAGWRLSTPRASSWSG